MSTRIARLSSLQECDDVSADDIEDCRKALGCTPADMAERLGWSMRKYLRTIETVREDEFAPRDVVLSLIGLLKISANEYASNALKRRPTKHSFFDKEDHSAIVRRVRDAERSKNHEWTAEVTPHVLREVAHRAAKGLRVTYNDLAEKLEIDGHTKRVWPRTAYGRPLGSVCSIITELGRITNRRIPLLSVIVVKQDGSPGMGFDGMTKDFFRVHEPEKYRTLLARMRADRDRMVSELQDEVLSYPHWDEVVETLGVA